VRDRGERRRRPAAERRGLVEPLRMQPDAPRAGVAERERLG